MSTLRTTYRWVAGLALLHMIGLGGGAAYLLGTGSIDADRLRQAVSVLRETDADESEAGDSAELPEVKGAGEVASASRSPEEQLLADEVEWRNTERYRTQLDQRLKLINTERLEVDRRREAFERFKEQERQEREAREEKESVAGYSKQVEIISALKPKAALGQLMSMNDVDAAQIMFRFDTRKVKKIIESAKTEEQRTKMTAIVRLIADLKSGGDAVEETP